MKQLFFLFLLFTLDSRADGLPLVNGRYIESEVLIFKLSPAQKQVIDHFGTCYLENYTTMNGYTPYVFSLTKDQALILREKVGFSPSTFDVYETYKGFNDAGPHWNLALRFSENEIEIPLDIVIPDVEAEKAHKRQGWSTSNPCFPNLQR